MAGRQDWWSHRRRGYFNSTCFVFNSFVRFSSLVAIRQQKDRKDLNPTKKKTRNNGSPSLSWQRKKGGEKELFYSGRPHSNSSSMHTLSAASLSSNPLTAPRFFFFSKSSPLFPPFLLLLPNWLKLWCFLKWRNKRDLPLFRFALPHTCKRLFRVDSSHFSS